MPIRELSHWLRLQPNGRCTDPAHISQQVPGCLSKIASYISSPCAAPASTLKGKERGGRGERTAQVGGERPRSPSSDRQEMVSVLWVPGQKLAPEKMAIYPQSLKIWLFFSGYQDHGKHSKSKSQYKERRKFSGNGCIPPLFTFS